jgi:hypothetical protein
MRHFHRRAALAAVAACGMLAASCDRAGHERIPETGATLEGTIKYGNEPVAAAMVIVAGADRSATGNVDEATGRYRVENAPTGAVKIGVNTDAAKGMLTGKLMSGYYNGPEAKSKKLTPPKIVDVPAKYANPETSGIKTTVNKGENTYDIVIPK